MKNSLCCRALLLAGCAGIATYAAPLAAQDTAPDPAADAQAADAQAAEADGVIYVTARRREERLLDVPLSVTALSG